MVTVLKKIEGSKTNKQTKNPNQNTCLNKMLQSSLVYPIPPSNNKNKNKKKKKKNSSSSSKYKNNYNNNNIDPT